VFHEFFTDEFIAAHPVEIGSAALSRTTDQLRLSSEEEQMVEEKLRGLGYI